MPSIWLWWRLHGLLHGLLRLWEGPTSIPRCLDTCRELERSAVHGIPGRVGVERTRFRSHPPESMSEGAMEPHNSPAKIQAVIRATGCQYSDGVNGGSLGNAPRWSLVCPWNAFSATLLPASSDVLTISRCRESRAGEQASLGWRTYLNPRCLGFLGLAWRLTPRWQHEASKASGLDRHPFKQKLRRGASCARVSGSNRRNDLHGGSVFTSQGLVLHR